MSRCFGIFFSLIPSPKVVDYVMFSVGVFAGEHVIGENKWWLVGFFLGVALPGCNRGSHEGFA